MTKTISARLPARKRALLNARLGLGIGVKLWSHHHPRTGFGRWCTELIFPGRGWRKPLSNMAMAVRRVNFGSITVHGFRSSFRDWSAERTTMPCDICGAALAHVIRDKVEAAYRRTDLSKECRALTAQGSRFLANDFGEKVVALEVS